MKPIKKYSLKFITNSKGKVYLRYFATIEKGIGKTYDKPCNCIISKQDLAKLNSNSLFGVIQKECNKIKDDIVHDIKRFHIANNTYPTPNQLRIWDTAIYSKFDINYFTNQYYKSLKIKGSSKATYGYTLKKFKEYFEYNLYNYSISDMINKNVIIEFSKWLIDRKRMKKKDISKISVYNSQIILFKYLNYIAEEFNISKIENFLKKPVEGEKYHINVKDVDKILQYEPKSFAQEEVLSIIRINRHIGLRIGEILTIDKRNVEIEDGICKIRFLEHKKSKVRTVIVVNKEAIEIINDHLINNYNSHNPNYLFHFNDRSGFNLLLKKICKEVFKDEKVLIFKRTQYFNDYKEYEKFKVISSHAFRRFAIERNINEFGIETARTLSGHSNYASIIKHYSDYLNENDLTNKLLKK